MTTTQPLPHILLLTHGGWGQPLCNSLRMVTGEIKGVTEIALMPVDTLGEFYQRVEAVVKTLPEGSLILTDFVGGTTSNVAARLSADYPVAVIAGLNASLLLEALDRREQGMLTACVDELVEAGRSSCLDVVAHVRQLQQSLEGKHHGQYRFMPHRQPSHSWTGCHEVGRTISGEPDSRCE